MNRLFFALGLLAMGCGGSGSNLFSDGQGAADSGSATEDGGAGDGGSSDIPMPTPPVGGKCPAGRTLCSGHCVVDFDPSYGCGSPTCAACAIAHGTPTCRAGACDVGSCNTGFADCNKVGADGCEVDTTSDGAHCGSCTNACTAAVCGNGTCSSTCPLGQTVCGAGCFDLETSPAHCGSCTTTCAAPAHGTATCAAHACGIACAAGYVQEGATCVDAKSWQDVGVGFDAACAVRKDGSVACWGFRTASPSGTNFTRVAVGTQDACGITTTGAISCWYGPLSSPPSGTFTQLSVGDVHGCALRTDQTVACWGSNSFGQASPPGGKFMAVSAGYRHSCGLRTDGSLSCWGDALNHAVSETPSTGTFTGVMASFDFSCAAGASGVTCWGSLPSAGVPSGVLTTVSGNSNLICGVLGDGTAACNDNAGYAGPPAGAFRVVEAGGQFACGIRAADGKVVCWGRNDSGQSTPPP